jgi:hypothetical protein
VYQEIEDVKAPRLKTREINVESKTEICNESERIIMPKPFEIQRVKRAVFQDIYGIIKLKSAGESVGVGREPDEQDQEKTSSRG